jgi:hypothetical protein
VETSHVVQEVTETLLEEEEEEGIIQLTSIWVGKLVPLKGAINPSIKTKTE